MKKTIICTFVLVAALASCQKDPSLTKSNLTSIDCCSLDGYRLGSSLSPLDTTGISLTGFYLHDARTGKLAKAVTGTLAVSVSLPGDLTLIGINNFAVLISSGQIYQGVYSSSLARIWTDWARGSKSYSLSWQPQHGSPDFICSAFARVTPSPDGRFYISISDGLIEFH